MIFQLVLTQEGVYQTIIWTNCNENCIKMKKMEPGGSTILHIFALGCARFPDFVKNSSERQILWSLCSVDFHTLTLQLPIQTLHSVAPELQVFVSSLENHQNFSKMSTPLLHKFACRREKFLRWLACQSSEMRSCLS